MNMKPPILSAAILALICSGLLAAADPQLLNLVMPDAKILAGINVDQAKTSAFGAYFLSQIQAQGAQHLQQVAALTGFDPTRDLHELLIASNAAPGGHSGLILAKGNFDASRIQAAGIAGGGTTTNYNTVTLLLDPKQTHAVAFLDSTLAVAGDVASVKAAIDRRNTPEPLSAALMVQVNQWSTAEDAWAVAATPLANLKFPVNPSNPPNPAIQNAFQNIQQAAGGVQFGVKSGDPIVWTGQLQADTAQNALSVAGVVQLLASFAKMQAQQKNPQAADILRSLSVTSSGNQVNLSLSVPEAQAEQALKAKAAISTPQSTHHGPRRVR